MTSRKVTVGRRFHKNATDQIITTTYSKEGDDTREHVTLETPTALSDTAIQRLRIVRESQKDWP